jgi:hypothetical protein
MSTCVRELSYNSLSWELLSPFRVNFLSRHPTVLAERQQWHGHTRCPSRLALDVPRWLSSPRNSSYLHTLLEDDC